MRGLTELRQVNAEPGVGDKLGKNNGNPAALAAEYAKTRRGIAGFKPVTPMTGLGGRVDAHYKAMAITK